MSNAPIVAPSGFPLLYESLGAVFQLELLEADDEGGDLSDHVPVAVELAWRRLA